MRYVLYAIAFVLMLTIIVSIHELGHLITAKKFGVFCGEYSIGMGPLIFKKQGKETQFSIRLLPIGGFVSMAGEEDDTKKEIEVPFERTINGIKWWQKVIVMMAGICMNIILATVLFIGINMYVGQVMVDPAPRFDAILENSPAEEAGFLPGDYVLKMTGEDGTVIVPESYDDIRIQINTLPQTYVFDLDRNGETVSIPCTPKETDGSYLLGVSANAEVKDINAFEAIGYGFKDTLENSTLIFKSLGTLFKGKNMKNLSGPVGIFNVTATAVDSGLLTFIHLLALLSLNIGIFNALPLPVLDGGRAVITIIEKIVGKEINGKLLDILMYAGAILLIAIMVFATVNDITKLF